MRRRAVVAWALAALAFALSLAGQELPGSRAWNLLAGVGFVVAVALGISLLPWWRDWLPERPPMAGLFTRPRTSERWCTGCGLPTPRKGPCRTCGHTPVSFGRRR